MSGRDGDAMSEPVSVTLSEAEVGLLMRLVAKELAEYPASARRHVLRRLLEKLDHA